MKIALVEVKSIESLNNIRTDALLAFYNERTGKATTKFASRTKGIAQVWTLIEAEVAAEQAAAAAPAPAAEPAPKSAPSSAPAAEKVRKPRGFRFKFMKRDEIKPVKAGSKRAKLLALLQQPGGATFEECMVETGWGRKDCYEAIRLLHYYVGYGLNQDDKTGKIWVVA